LAFKGKVRAAWWLKKHHVRLLFGLALFSAALGTSATAATAGRHLRYAFAVYSTTDVTTHAGSNLSGPGTATMDVDFLGPGPRGGMLIRAEESWWHELRAEQAVTCEVDAGGSLTCDQHPVPSMAEFVLFPMLAQNYFNEISASKWQQHYTIALPANYYRFSTTVKLNVLRWSGPVADIETEGVTQAVGGPLERQIEHGSVKFDRSSALPIAIHEEWTPTMLDDTAPAAVDFKLVEQST